MAILDGIVVWEFVDGIVVWESYDFSIESWGSSLDGVVAWQLRMESWCGVFRSKLGADLGAGIELCEVCLKSALNSFRWNRGILVWEFGMESCCENLSRNSGAANFRLNLVQDSWMDWMDLRCGDFT